MLPEFTDCIAQWTEQTQSGNGDSFHDLLISVGEDNTDYFNSLNWPK
jgi:hypothetical protein